jgi:hypothetical protein
MSPVSSTASTPNWSTTCCTRSKPEGLRCRSDTCSSTTLSSAPPGAGSVESTEYRLPTLATRSSSDARYASNRATMSSALPIRLFALTRSPV